MVQQITDYDAVCVGHAEQAQIVQIVADHDDAIQRNAEAFCERTDRRGLVDAVGE